MHPTFSPNLPIIPHGMDAPAIVPFPAYSAVFWVHVGINQWGTPGPLTLVSDFAL